MELNNGQWTYYWYTVQFYVIDIPCKIALCLYCFIAVSVDDIAKKEES